MLISTTSKSKMIIPILKRFEFNNDIDACEYIIKNANKFTREFYSKRKMLEIARMTAMKYMEFTDA